MSRVFVQSQVESFEIPLKWYLIPPCLTLSNIKYVSLFVRLNQNKADRIISFAEGTGSNKKEGRAYAADMPLYTTVWK